MNYFLDVVQNNTFYFRIYLESHIYYVKHIKIIKSDCYAHVGSSFPLWPLRRLELDAGPRSVDKLSELILLLQLSDDLFLDATGDVPVEGESDGPVDIDDPGEVEFEFILRGK